MKKNTFLSILLLSTTLCACQSEDPKEQDKSLSKEEFCVRATLPETVTTRALLEYGHDDEKEEIFEWTKQDYISIINISQFEELHTKAGEVLMVIKNIDGIKADFVPDYIDDDDEAAGKHFFEVTKPGDTILAIFGVANPADLAEAVEGTTNLISYFAGSNWTAQKIVDSPTTYNALTHVHDMMRMYDIVKVDENGKIPELHFKHLNAIIRITLQNQTGVPLFGKMSEVVFSTSPDDIDTFIYGFSYCSVETNDVGESYLKENFKKIPERHPLNPTAPDTTQYVLPMTSHIINRYGGATLNDGDTYELYAIVSPRIGHSDVSDKFTIDLYDGVESGFYAGYEDASKYTISIDNFNRAIEPGKRYWFRLTATDIIDRQEEIEIVVKDDNGQNSKSKKLVDVKKLMFTSEWTDKYGNKNNNSEETSNDE